MNNLVEDRIQTMSNISNLFNKISKKCRFGISIRETIFLAYFDMNLEYTRSIHILVRKEQYGVSAALVRLHFESLLRAIWSLRCATDEEINKINEDKFIFPKIWKIVQDIDDIWGQNNSYQNLKSKHWKVMCDYTHTGNSQLAKRFTNGELKPNYSDDMILGILDGVEFIIQEFILHLLDGHNCSKEFNIMLKHFSINLENS